MADVLVPRVMVTECKYEARMLEYRLSRAEVSVEYVKGWLNFCDKFVTQNAKVSAALHALLDPAIAKAVAAKK